MPTTPSPGEEKFIVPEPDAAPEIDPSLSMARDGEGLERQPGFGDLQENRTARGQVRQYAGDLTPAAR